MIETQTAYHTPCVVEIAFKFGGPLCQSKNESELGPGTEDFEHGGDIF